MSLHSGISWSLIAVVGRLLIQFGSTLIMARLLVPTDFGLAAMVGTVATFLSFFSDFGLSWITIQSKKIEEQQVSNLFWINTGLGAILGIFCVLAAPLVADFYRQNALIPFLCLQGLTFLFLGAAVQPMALLKRNMQFKDLAISDLGSVILTAAMAIAMAVAGAGVWSLILSSVIGQFLRVLWVFWQSKIKIHRFRADHHLKSYFHVGRHITSASFFFYFARNLDDVLTGRFFGPTSLGFYSRAYLLANMPTQQPAQALSNVVISNIARQKESNEDWHATYQKILIGFSSFVSPMAAGMALTSNESIRLLYGANWAPVAPLLFWISLAGVFQPAYNSVGWLLLGLEKYRAYFWWSLVSAVILAVGFFTAVSFDVGAIAISYFITGGLLLSIPSQYWAHRQAGVSFKPIFLDLLKIYFSLAMMAVATTLISRVSFLTMDHYVMRLTAMALGGAATYILFIRLLFKKLPIDFISWARQL